MGTYNFKNTNLISIGFLDEEYLDETGEYVGNEDWDSERFSDLQNLGKCLCKHVDNIFSLHGKGVRLYDVFYQVDFCEVKTGYYSGAQLIIDKNDDIGSDALYYFLIEEAPELLKVYGYRRGCERVIQKVKYFIIYALARYGYDNGYCRTYGSWVGSIVENPQDLLNIYKAHGKYYKAEFENYYQQLLKDMAG